jgi:osmotically-inducible protein OsmY
MSSRYDDRDYDREGQNRGRRSESDYGRSWGGRSQGRYRYGDNERDNESYSRERGYGSESRGRGAESSGRGSQYGSSRGGTYDRGGEYGGRGEYSQGGDSSGRYSTGSPRDYQDGRQRYGGNWEYERDDVNERDERHGDYMGGYGQGYNQRSGSYGRGYDESSRRSSESSQRYNYPTGFRSGQLSEERGGSFDYDRGGYGGSGSRYGEGESRNWTGDDRSSQSDKGDWSGSYSSRSGDWGSGRQFDDRSGGREIGNWSSGRQSSGDWSGSYGGRELRDRSDEVGHWGDDRNRGQQQRGWWDRASDEVASWFGDEDAERRRRMDARRSRGPKGYQRSDERIREDVSDRMTDDYYLDASDVEVQVSGAEVILTGTVKSRNEKRRAEDLAESVSGVTNVENRIRVRQGERSAYSQTESTDRAMGSAATGTSLGTGASMGTSGTTDPSLDTGRSLGTGTSMGTATMGTGTAGETGTASSSSSGLSAETGAGTGTGTTRTSTEDQTGNRSGRSKSTGSPS